MRIEDFAETVKDGVIKRIGDNCNVSVQKVNKNNGVVHIGLLVQKEGSNLSPIIYLDSQYKKIRCEEKSLPQIVDYVVKTAKGKARQVDMRLFLNFGSIEGCIIYSLVNTERNIKLLEDRPHVDFMDLSVVFQCMLDSDCYGTTLIRIHNAHLKLWDVTVNDLFQAAAKNTPLLMGYEFKDMKDVFHEIIESEQPEEAVCYAHMYEIENSVPMYVLSNRHKTEGAACIIYPGLLSDICNKLESSFYVIPSSIHETLLLPADNTDDRDEIKAIIKGINDTQVMEEEILSYSLYFYEKQEKKLYIV